MKFRVKIFSVICIILFTAGISYSQQDSAVNKTYINKDTLKIGKYYSFYLSDKEAILGKVTAKDENTILIYSEGEIKTINRNDIVSIEDAKSILYELSVNRKKIGQDRVYWLFGGGYLIVKNKSASLDYNFDNGFNIYANSLITFNNNFGLRADFDYNHIPNNDNYHKEYNYSNNTSSTYKYSGGSINSLLMRFNLSFGYLDPESFINFFFVPGIGFGGYLRTPRTKTDVNSGQLDYSYSSDIHFTIGVSAGLGLSIKLTDKLRFSTEYQANAWTGDSPNYANIKAGIILIGR